MLYKLFNFLVKKSNRDVLIFYLFNQGDFQKKLQEDSSSGTHAINLASRVKLWGNVVGSKSWGRLYKARDMSSHYMHGVEPLTQVKRASCRSSQNITQKWVTKQISQMKNLNNESNNYQKTIKKHKKRYSTPLRNLKHL